MNIACDVANNYYGVVAHILQTLKMKRQGVLMTIPRITIVCCISAAGEKLPILVIGTAERPFCFYDKGKKKNYPIPAIKSLKLITTSWDNITKKAIIRCWLKADILSEGQTRRMEGLVGGDNSWVGSGLPEDKLKSLKSKVSTVVVAQNCSKEYKIAVEAMKQLF